DQSSWLRWRDDNAEWRGRVRHGYRCLQDHVRVLRKVTMPRNASARDVARETVALDSGSQAAYTEHGFHSCWGGSMAEEALGEAARRLEACGHRATPQRMAVLAALLAQRTFVTAQEMHGVLRRVQPHLGLAKVYSTLELL